MAIEEYQQSTIPQNTFGKGLCPKNFRPIFVDTSKGDMFISSTNTCSKHQFPLNHVSFFRTNCQDSFFLTEALYFHHVCVNQTPRKPGCQAQHLPTFCRWKTCGTPRNCPPKPMWLLDSNHNPSLGLPQLQKPIWANYIFLRNLNDHVILGRNSLILNHHVKDGPTGGNRWLWWICPEPMNSYGILIQKMQLTWL